MQIFRESESLFVYDADQFDDYSKHESTLFDVEAKPKKRKEEFKDWSKGVWYGGSLLRRLRRRITHNGLNP